MLYSCNKYLNHFLLKPILTIGFIFSFSIAAFAQMYNSNKVGKYPRMNPLLYAAFKNPLTPNPQLSEFIKPSKYELMFWPNFPLTPAQVETRNREWERKYNRPIGQQILSDIATEIIKYQVNSLIYDKKMPVAVAPKF